jgi:hypothetical protein
MKMTYVYIGLALYLATYVLISESMIDVCRQYNIRGYYYILPYEDGEWGYRAHCVLCVVYLPCDLVRKFAFNGTGPAYSKPLTALNYH